jgi:hypothetical protein
MKRPPGDLIDSASDPKAMVRTQSKRFENEQIQRALQKVGCSS